MSGDSRMLLSDKVRSRNNNNSRIWYYDLSIVLCLGVCYRKEQEEIEEFTSVVGMSSLKARRVGVSVLRISFT